MRHRNDLIVLLVMIGGLLLNIYAPLWLAPPLFEFTVWFYFIIFFAWIPVYLVLMRGKRRGRLIVLFILVAMLTTCSGCVLFNARSASGLTFLDSWQCEGQPAAAGRSRYICARVASDGPEVYETWTLEGIAGLPVLWIVEAEGWCNPVCR